MKVNSGETRASKGEERKRLRVRRLEVFALMSEAEEREYGTVKVQGILRVRRRMLKRSHSFEEFRE